MVLKTIYREPIEIEKLLNIDKSNYTIDYSKIIKQYIVLLEYRVGEIINICNKEKMLNERYSIKKQEEDLLFELKQHKESIIEYLKSRIFHINSIEIDFDIKTLSAGGYENHIKAKDLVNVRILIEFIKDFSKNNKFQIDLNYYLNLETEKGWH